MARAASCCAALGVLLLLAAAVEARFAPEEPSFGRALLQETVDPDTCTARKGAACSACKYIRSGGVTTIVCTACGSGWRLNDSGSCECQPGYYGASCAACDVGYYCAGGSADKVQCTTPGLTTLFLGASREDQCVTQAGYGRSTGGAVAQCALNTFNEGGNRRPCTPCGRGLQTADVGKSSPKDCLAPEGFYFDRNTAKQCPRGTYKSGLNAVTSCTPCTTGASTAVPTAGAAGATSSADCVYAKPGYYLDGADSPHACGLNKYNDAFQLWTSGSTSCSDCGTNLVTTTQTARSAAACVAPDGYGYVAYVDAQNPAHADQCAEGTYKAGNNRKGCVACGVNGAGQAIWHTSPASGASSFSACYISTGYGTKRAPGNTDFNGWLVEQCPANTYGASADTYGVRNLPCTPCPKGMHSAAGSNGPEDCLTDQGWGYDSVTQTAQLCPLGYWSAGNSREECTYCGTGFTTALEGSISSDACVIAPGYGYVAGAAPEPCAFGWYGLGGAATTTCTACPASTWTTKEQATLATDCNVCRAGLGPLSSGACAMCAVDTYSVGGSAGNCDSCPTDYVSPKGSISAAACVPLWTELDYSVDVVTFNYLKNGDAQVATPTLTTNDADHCRTACAADATCMYWAYSTAGVVPDAAAPSTKVNCFHILNNAAGADRIAFQNADTFYTVYQFTSTRTVGDTIDPASLSAALQSDLTAATTLQKCTQVCDKVPNCVAAVSKADTTCVLKAARMSDEFMSTDHNTCEIAARSSVMNVATPGDTTPWSAPVYVEGVYGTSAP